MMKPGGVKVSSSPGREKLPGPPGLARLLYGKALGNRSRGRSASASSAARSSPMFVSRSRSRGRSSSAAAAVAAATVEGEPSSPKVTCMGQIRMRKKRSAKLKKPDPKKTRSKSSLIPCRCLHKALLCGLFPVRRRPTGGGGGGTGGGGRRSLWWRWACIRSGRSGRYQRREADPVRPPPEFVPCAKVLDGREDVRYDEDEEVEETAAPEETKVFMSSATGTPPKNALLLMRCRSAPHNRASALATARFEVSPLQSPETPAAKQPDQEVAGAKARDEEEEEDKRQQQEEQRRASGGAALVQEAEAEAGDEARGSESQRPLVLPRSKSEPARRAAAKLAVPEASYCFWTSHSSGSRRRRSRSPPPASGAQRSSATDV